MKQKYSKPKVFFNASVILAGLASPLGGSAKLLKLVKQKRIIGIISEIILDETYRHIGKIRGSKATIEKSVLTLFPSMRSAPNQELVQKFAEIAIDQGDAHVLASTREAGAEFLVTLDKKHLLILQNKIKGIAIVSPGQFLEWFLKS